MSRHHPGGPAHRGVKTTHEEGAAITVVAFHKHHFYTAPDVQPAHSPQMRVEEKVQAQLMKALESVRRVIDYNVNIRSSAASELVSAL